MASTAAATSRATAGSPAALKEALLAAFVTFVLLAPLLGMRTASGPDGMTLEFHFGWVFLSHARWYSPAVCCWSPGAGGPSGMTLPGGAALAKLGGAIAAQSWWLAAAGLVFAFVLPFLPFANRYVVDIGTTVLIYVMLGWGLNIVVGLAGLLDLGYVAFYAVGAYSYALFAQTFGLGFWTCLPLAGLLAASFGVMLGFPVLRLRGDYLAIVTLGFGEIIRIVLLNWYEVTGGPNGISDIPRPSFFGMAFERNPPEGHDRVPSVLRASSSPACTGSSSSTS